MDTREKGPDLLEIIHSAIDARQASMMTAIPVKVVKDSDGHTVALQPLIKSVIRQPDGSDKLVEYPVISDAPVQFSGGGGATFTHPIKEGDEGIALVSAKAIDAWHQQGGVQQPTDMRMHDLSDSMYIPGIRSTKRKLENVSTTSSQMRSDDGKHVVDMHPTNGLSFNSQKAINMSVTEGGKTSTVAITGGGIAITGEKLSHNAKNISGDHKHTGVEPGGGESGPPEAA